MATGNSFGAVDPLPPTSSAEGYIGRLAKCVTYMERGLSLFKATLTVRYLDQTCFEAADFFIKEEDRIYSGRRWSEEAMMLETLLCGKESMSLDDCLEAVDACKTLFASWQGKGGQQGAQAQPIVDPTHMHIIMLAQGLRNDALTLRERLDLNTPDLRRNFIAQFCQEVDKREELRFYPVGYDGMDQLIANAIQWAYMQTMIRYGPDLGAEPPKQELTSNETVSFKLRSLCHALKTIIYHSLGRIKQRTDVNEAKAVNSLVQNDLFKMLKWSEKQELHCVRQMLNASVRKLSAPHANAVPNMGSAANAYPNMGSANVGTPAMNIGNVGYNMSFANADHNMGSANAGFPVMNPGNVNHNMSRATLGHKVGPVNTAGLNMSTANAGTPTMNPVSVGHTMGPPNAGSNMSAATPRPRHRVRHSANARSLTMGSVNVSSQMSSSNPGHNMGYFNPVGSNMGSFNTGVHIGSPHRGSNTSSVNQSRNTGQNMTSVNVGQHLSFANAGQNMNSANVGQNMSPFHPRHNMSYPSSGPNLSAVAPSAPSPNVIAATPAQALSSVHPGDDYELSPEVNSFPGIKAEPEEDPSDPYFFFQNPGGGGGLLTPSLSGPRNSVEVADPSTGSPSQDTYDSSTDDPNLPQQGDNDFTGFLWGN
ncbi:hypothetical protein B0H63DRAFT_523407 [Podospora didyma]|uniref:Uncharacterized protein n=1 Tax=Podospora didyma TaxID=330526 RepID=A0AAE0NQZ8_9PEZI|nr:hypothetical protein B0H63DRAFT_523407 [Podospora didyma]